MRRKELTEEQLKRMDKAMRDAAETIRELKQHKLILAKMLLAEREAHEETRNTLGKQVKWS